MSTINMDMSTELVVGETHPQGFSVFSLEQDVLNRFSI